MTLDRRGLLALTGLSGIVTACGALTRSTAHAPTGSPRRATRIRYGDEHGSQFADLRMPTSTPRATVVLLHGGYWLPQYGLDLMAPMAQRFTDLGYATWNVEYRRTDAGGGFPHTLTDVAAAVDRLGGSGLPAALSANVVLVGHSAGGQLACWAASRTTATPGGAPAFPLRGVISLAGVLDMTQAGTDPRTSAPVTAFLGGTPTQVPARYALADPARLVPASCQVWAVSAAEDQVVPREQAISYVELARSAGGRVQNVELPGDHYTVIDPKAPSFGTIRSLVDRATTT